MTSSEAPIILLAPTAFKGTLGPAAAARAMAAGVARIWPASERVERPLSDGGNGLLEAYAALESGVLETAEISGPLGAPTRARYLRSGSTAVIESAEACGLHLVPPARRDPLSGSTRGVGELLLSALRGGAERVVLGLGGSATADGGTGMARALGWSFTDARGEPLAEGGAALTELRRVTPPARPFPARTLVLCDVGNPLLGPQGAARVYGPQKGAGPEAVAVLEKALVQLARVLEADLGITVAELTGAGAAGGLGAGAHVFLGGELVAGADWMIERAALRRLLRRARLLITGEGRFDEQSAMGKLTGRVIALARGAGVRVLLVCGRVEADPGPGVETVDGGGRELGGEELAQLVADACRALAAGGRL